MKTMICFVLDRSGSMSGRESDVVGGVNNFIEKQQQLREPASIALVRFDTGMTERFRPMQDLKAMMPIIRDDFVPRGGTPLLDAVGDTLLALDLDWAAERPDRAIMVIVTDGVENSSRRYSKPQIKRMIEARQESGKWAFIYLGADVDAFGEASALGIYTSNAANWAKTAEGTRSTYGAVGQTVSAMRAEGSSTVASNLGGNIKADGTVEKWGGNGGAAQAKGTEAWTTPAPTWTPPA